MMHSWHHTTVSQGPSCVMLDCSLLWDDKFSRAAGYYRGTHKHQTLEVPCTPLLSRAPSSVVEQFKMHGIIFSYHSQEISSYFNAQSCNLQVSHPLYCVFIRKTMMQTATAHLILNRRIQSLELQVGPLFYQTSQVRLSLYFVANVLSSNEDLDFVEL